MIFPTVTCPRSHTVTLTQQTTVVTLDGAETKDNTGIQLLEYRAIVDDDSAVYEEPDKLVLSRESVGHTYTIAVTTKDLDDNEARCNYTISVAGKFEITVKSHSGRRKPFGVKISCRCEHSRGPG